MVVAAPLNCSPHTAIESAQPGSLCARGAGGWEKKYETMRGVLMTSFSCAHTEKDDVDGKVENSSLWREL
jgi:hypothetical protein